MGELRKLLDSHYSRKQKRLSAVVEAIPKNASGKPTGYITAEVAGQSGVKVYTGPSDVYYPGDSITVEQVGNDASAVYTVKSLHAGLRPSSGYYEFQETTTIGTQEFNEGDLLFGNPSAANWWFDYSTGIMYLRTAGIINGSINAAGYIDLGATNAVHLHLDNNVIEFKNGDTLLSSIDAIGRTIYGFERWGRPHGPGIETREFIDNSGETRYIWSILGTDGRVGISFVTGNTSNADDYKFYVGPQNATQRLVYENGSLYVTGTITATAGTIGGWTISSTQLASTSSAIVLTAGGVVNVNNQAGMDGSDATWRIWAGQTYTNRATAPFRVDKDGNVYSSSLKSLSGTNSPGSGAYVIDVTGTGSGANAIRGIGDGTGIYGQANKYGISGKALGATGAAGVYGTGVSSYAGVWGHGAPGVYAEANTSGDYSLQLSTGDMNANSLNIKNVNYLYCSRVYFDATHYLYLSGDDIYWYNGATGTKLN